MPSKRTTKLLGDLFKVDPNWFRIESIPEPSWEDLPRRSVLERMPKSLHDGIEAQWQAQSLEQMKELLLNRVAREDWGAVRLIADKLLDRTLTEFNQKLMKGEQP